jgi:phosphomannomutase/phosphoglucomutase
MSNNYHPPKDLIISPSGMRGEIAKSLTLEVVNRFSQSFGLWLGENSTVLIGRDTRNSGIMISSCVTAALNSVGIHVLDAGIASTPAILWYKRVHNIDGAAIISASHNPPQYNGIKFLSRTHTFLGNEELNEINKYFLSSNSINTSSWQKIGNYKSIDITKPYLDSIKRILDINLIKKRGLRVVVDPNAGAGVGVTDKILSDLGCHVKVINGDFKDYPQYPHPIEPIKPHLTELSEMILQYKADLGIAHDCDADRVAIAGKDGTIYPEDTTVALLIRYILETYRKDSRNNNHREIYIITNSASSLMFEKLAEMYNAEVIRTPIGERYIAIKMFETMKEHPDTLVFGGEGSSGGFMYPSFNNARDGIFAACKVCEMLAYYKYLFDSLPKLYTTRDKITVSGINVNDVMNKMKRILDNDKIDYSKVDNDIKILDSVKQEWTLIHPSNTEPIIRVITEALTEERAKTLCDDMSIKMRALMK